MILPQEILEKLKCVKCFNYLSCGPVYVSKSGQNICGRCSVRQFASLHRLVYKPYNRGNESNSSSRHDLSGASRSNLSAADSSEIIEESVYLNTAYNEIAILYDFPCQYEIYGCIEKKSFSNMKEHEANCCYRPCECPVDDQCGWVGSVTAIEAHTLEDHPTQALQQTLELERDMTKASCGNYLIRINEELFIVRTKISLVTCTIYCGVCKIGTIKENMNFKYTLTIETKNGTCVRKGEVVSQKFITDDISVAINLGSMIITSESANNAKFTLEIEGYIKCNKCKAMKAPQEVTTYDDKNDIFYCHQCMLILLPCKNMPSGCLWRGVAGYRFNHEALFCPFTKWCDSCKQDITESSMLHHMRLQNHLLHKINHLHGQYWKTEGDKEQTIVTVQCRESSFMIICKKQYLLSYKFMLFGPYKDVHKIRCFLILRNSKNDFLVSYIMRVAYSTNCGQFVWIKYLEQEALEPIIADNSFEFCVEIYNTDTA